MALGSPAPPEQPAASVELTSQQREFLSVMGYLFLEHDRPERAAKIFGALGLLYPDDVYIVKSLAYALLRMGDYARALAAADSALASGASAEDSDFLQLVRGRALWNLQRPEEAQLAMRGVLRRRQRKLQDES